MATMTTMTTPEVPALMIAPATLAAPATTATPISDAVAALWQSFKLDPSFEPEGPNPDPKLFDFYSSHKQVNAQTPPTFLLTTTGDSVVPAQNCLLMYEALKKAGVACEMHVFEKGAHGYGMKQTHQPVTDFWPSLLEAWMKQHGW